jgi:hypothetical protein
MGGLLNFARAFALAAVLMAAGAAGAQVSAPVERPPQAQEALARGFAFAQQKQWALAIRYFRTAQQAAPADPAILLNLGLANQQVPGRELIAAAWYRAFLAAAPQVREADEVRKQLVKIEIATEAAVQKLLDTAAAVAQQWPEAKDQQKIHERVARARAVAGDIPGAQQLAARLDAGAAGWAFAEIAVAYAETGNLDLAAQLAGGIKAARARAWALAEVAAAQAKRGDFAGALRTTQDITIAGEAAWAHSRIAALQGRAGDAAGAEATAAKIDKKHAASHAVALTGVALGMAKSGLPWRVRDLLAEAAREAATAQRFEERLAALMHVARARAEAGDMAGAEQAVHTIPEGRERYLALSALAQAKNDLARAEIYRWTAFALDAETRTGQTDINILLKAAQGQSPVAAAVSLAKAAEERARLMQALRKPA